MHSEPAIENRADGRSRGRGRRRKSGKGADGSNASDVTADGPVFVDNSGRRAKLLRRFGTFVGVVCLGYAVVLGMAFMGWGTSLTPSSLLPFGGGGPGGSQRPGSNQQPQGGFGAAPSGAPTGGATPPTKPSGTPPAGIATGEPPASTPTPAATAGATATASASADAN
ncbi:hypothetical protein [Streptomyces sp. AK08-02]|uniref:hypothetical protein n=1 Tax=Streptomyces sp. AK08-02 TaxID=3028654 RepID=UPI0029A58D64|nr:hypothetical protein [Streptomyces sp. AK08-02]MDX3747816.1 hypothetical protein [Streptomyces sp. AK08-02]